MQREEAYEHLLNRISNDDLIKHSIAVEAIMRKFAEFLKEDVEIWGLAGLLHDIDCETTADNPARHGLVGADILEGIGLDEAIVYSVRAHNDYHKIERKRKMDKVLYSANPVADLIIAAALILPEKKLSNVSIEFLLKRLDEMSNVKYSNREQIIACSEFGVSLEDFFRVSLKALQDIAEELGL